MTRADADFIVIGAGSAGCVVAAELARRQAGSVLVLEAGPSERHPLVNMPFGLVWLMGSGRDWRYQTVPQPALDGRRIPVPRGPPLVADWSPETPAQPRPPPPRPHP